MQPGEGKDLSLFLPPTCPEEMCPDGKLEKSLEVLTELPLELWIDILQLAVAVPDPLEYPLVIHPACSSNVLSTCAMKRYREALVGNPNIVRHAF